MRGVIRTREMNICGKKFINVWFYPFSAEYKQLLGDLDGALGNYFKNKFPIVYKKLKEGYEVIADVEAVRGWRR